MDLEIHQYVEPLAMPHRALEHTPLKRVGQSEDIADCVLYLASEASSFVTGQDFIVDGGYTC
ncbi:MAG: SDR family oxidoreductase [Lachnotalea sp.]